MAAAGVVFCFVCLFVVGVFLGFLYIYILLLLLVFLGGGVVSDAI